MWQWPGVRSSGDCFDIQFLLLSVAAVQNSGPLGSHALLVSYPPEHQSRKERWAPLASMCSLDKEKVFRRIDNAETSTSRETTRSPARRFAARSLLVSCPPGTMVSSYRRSSLSLLAANSSGCLFGKAAHCPGFMPVWCLPEQESLESDEPLGSCCHCSAVSLERRAAICIRCRCLTRLVLASVTSSFGNTKGIKTVHEI